MSSSSARPETLDVIADVFRRYGYEGASLSRISAATGLGRSSLYHHFPNGKDDMARAAVARVEAQFADAVISPLNGEGRPAERLAQALDALARLYDHGARACLGEVFGLPDAVAAAPGGARKLLSALLDGFAKLARDAGADPAEARSRAEAAVCDLEGALVLSRALETTAPFRQALVRISTDLVGPSAVAPRAAD